ncbi:hypothetical protein L6164_006957 [Bauhinia variegata]|uniref:Uncharacterized protein n=1 Tax=Bauhinia variegata TaxID=167791 RepID=A0ACB9PW11_BAUVA|nr:hypothetical protein L6164_006957 [Bauhinia variegata]
MGENLQVKNKPTIPSSLSIFTGFSGSFSSEKSSNLIKSPRNFEGGVVGLGIVAAMSNLSDAHDPFFFANGNGPISPRSNPIPIVSSAKPAANFLGKGNTETVALEGDEFDECSEGYTCVISHLDNNTIKKRVYFDDELNHVGHFSPPATACMLTVSNGVFSASPVNFEGLGRELMTSDFLNCCYLCKKHLHGVDIFMYRGERAFCSADCREMHIMNDEYKEKRMSSGAIKPLDCSMSPSSGPPVSFAGIVAA